MTLPGHLTREGNNYTERPNMTARQWDLDDIASASDLAAELGYRKATVANWAARYPDFPAALTTVACGHIALYSLREVRAWYEARDWRTVKSTGQHIGGDRRQRPPP